MLRAKVSDTPEKLEQGLMFVEHLPEDEGMVFIFPKSEVLHFWGKNTFIPLDIAFVDKNNVIVKISKIKPFDLRSISSGKNCAMAIEANSGYFDSIGVSVGDIVVIDRGSFRDDAHITFEITKKSSIKTQIKEGQALDSETNTEDNQELSDSDLPIIDPSSVTEYLEDSFDEQDKEEPADELDGRIDQDQDRQPNIQPDTDIPKPKKYPVFSNIFEAAKWGESNGEVMRINYVTEGGRQITRDIEPHGSFHAKSTHRSILVTYDQTVNDIRAFIMMNVRNWAFVGASFKKKFIVRG